MKSQLKYQIIFGSVVLAVIVGNYCWHRYGGWRLPKQLYKERVEVVGRIASLPQQTRLGASFNLELEYINGQSAHSLIKLGGFLPAQNQNSLSVGDRWQFVTHLKPIHTLHNFDAFDHERSLILQGIRATGYIVARADNKLLLHDPLYFPLLYLRQIIQQKIVENLNEFPEQAAIISALTVGSTTSMTNSQWQVFRLTGTSHLVAISGLHIGLMASLGFILFKWFGKLFPRIFLSCPSPNFGAMGACLFALLYAALAGFAWPTQRSLIMILTLSVTQICYRWMPLWRRLAWSFVVILIFEPWGIFSASCILSFCAVACLSYGLGGRWQAYRSWRQWWQMQWIIFIGLFPISLYYFKQVSLVMLLANFIAIPWVAWLVVPLSLLACFLLLISQPLAHWLFMASAYLLKWLWVCLTFLSEWPWAAWHHNLSQSWLLLLVSIGAAVLVAPSGLPGRALGALGLGLLFFYQPSRPAKGEWWMTVLDVGQGLSVVVQTKTHVMIYDTGVRYPGAFDAGRDVALPFLEARQLQNVDLLVISHADNDHSGGAAALVSTLNIKQILSSIPEKFKSWWVNPCVSGQAWNWDGIDFKVLAPSPSSNYHGNDSSCVIKFGTAEASVLLSGDIQRSAEHYLLEHARSDLSATVLIAPHHGSLSSSIEPFVRAVGAQIVIFATGFLNRYHFPNPKIVSLYQRYHANMLSSARDGAIELRYKPELKAPDRLIVTTAIKHEKYTEL